MAVLPETGGILGELVVPDATAPSGLRSLLRGPRDDAEARENGAYLGAWMVPFANRVRGGTYRFGDVEHRLVTSDVVPGHALHGLVARMPMHVRAIEASSDRAMIELELLFAGAEGYPFSFELGVTYILSAEGLSTRCEVKNVGTFAMPLVFGWHPYLELAEGRAAYDLVLPACERIELDAECIPTARRLPAVRSVDLARQGLDDCYLLEASGDRVETIVRAKDGSREIVLWQEVVGRYEFLQVYTPGEEALLAIEPMTGGIDAFNNGLGLRVLSPAETVDASAGLLVRSIR